MLNALADDVAFLCQRVEEMPVLLANSQVGNRGPLHNPTAVINGWGPPLTPPNPQTHDKLITFTDKDTVIDLLLTC